MPTRRALAVAAPTAIERTEVMRARRWHICVWTQALSQSAVVASAARLANQWQKTITIQAALRYGAGNRRQQGRLRAALAERRTWGTSRQTRAVIEQATRNLVPTLRVGTQGSAALRRERRRPLVRLCPRRGASRRAPFSLRRRHFARHEIIQPVLVAATGGGGEPIPPRPALHVVGGGAIVDRGGVVEEMAAVQASACATVQMVDACRVVGVGAAPFGHECVQGIEVGVVVGGIADDNVVAAIAVERVAATAADQQIAAGAALQRV